MTSIYSIYYFIGILIALVVSLRLLKLLVVRFFTSDYYKSLFAARMQMFSELHKSGQTKSSKMRSELISVLNMKIAELGGDVVEIGAGPGNNTKFLQLPEGSFLIVVDYNPHMEKIFRKNMETDNPNLHLKEFLVQSADDMSEIPDGSVSAVLATHLLCSLDDQQTRKVLKEIMRVLRPGGCYFFLEHVIDKPGTMRRAVQCMLGSVTGIWQLVADGCNPDKDTCQEIHQAGFGSVTLKNSLTEQFYLWNDPIYTITSYVTRPKLWGHAVKHSIKRCTEKDKLAKLFESMAQA
ncbi:predicted protein [Nematostella vectensis]|uniref:Methyltransferase type 11 domain-containing protein n=1 Tax=Nematostella vectensis TaxID=45351 RepID=A7S2R1_NEMVE|nr:thiol S-methyltransferase METTL7B [Nematostella vectensis]EDO41937.1 predicted protein [Nematostella vectensis]|eukprot:XP_001634000.1 predicted protein [Nematostella vectensis]